MKLRKRKLVTSAPAPGVRYFTAAEVGLGQPTDPGPIDDSHVVHVRGRDIGLVPDEGMADDVQLPVYRPFAGEDAIDDHTRHFRPFAVEPVVEQSSAEPAPATEPPRRRRRRHA